MDNSFAERDIHRYSPNLTTQALWADRNVRRLHGWEV